MIDLTNVTLHTKDGRKIGNAICVGNIDNHYKVKTDYGNIAELSAEELNSMFYIGGVADNTHKHHTDNQ